MQITILPDADAVAKKAAEFIAEEARAVVAQRGTFTMAISGGHTPWVMLRELAAMDVPWKSVHIFQVDERIAPAGDADRNPTHLQESLLDHAPLPPENLHAMPVESVDLLDGVDQYSATLAQFAGNPPVLDLVHLGMGPDGHTASLVPGDPVLGVTNEDVALTSKYMGRRRMTLTFPIINRTRRVLWLVTGSEKAALFTRLRNGDKSIPAGCVQSENAVLMADEAARGSKIEPAGTSMRLGIATDHGGFALKEEIIARLRDAGHEVTDFGAHQLAEGDDYPDFVLLLAHAVAAGKLDRGIAICGSGVGASVCANKVPGIRAALIHDHFSAKQGAEDDHMNILCMGGRTVGPAVAWDLVQTYLVAEYSQEERHVRRLAKVAKAELQIRAATK
ncbi:MAG TPA: 6-phosphogluconolactonase [Verrucomicrobiae bacterium]|nr:6-phosphogluconolactonase [Verrucomicrobiae bacterium]